MRVRREAYDERIEDEFLHGALEDLLLDRLLDDHPVHRHRLLLADPVRAILRLDVGLRVPVRIEEDDRVGRLQVDAEPAGPRRQEEDELRRALRVERDDRLVALGAARAAVDPAVLVLPHAAVVLEDVEHSRHLREDQHSVAVLLQPLEQLVQHDELAARLDKMLALDEWRPRLLSVEQIPARPR